MKKRIILCIGIFVALAAAAIPIYHATQGVDIQSVVAEKQDIAVNLKLDGEVDFTEIYTASCLQAGSVGEMLVEEGEEIAQGALLVKMDTSALQKQLTSLQEQERAWKEETQAASSTNTSSLLEEAQKSSVLDMAQAASFDLHGFNQAFSENASADAEDALAASAGSDSLGSSGIQNSELQERIQEISQQIESSEYTSQLAGTVLAVQVKKGDVVAEGTPMVTIGNLSSAQIVAMVGENDIKKLSEGMACSIRMQGSDTVCTGKIVSIGVQMSAAALEGGSKKAKVCIKPDEPLVGCMAGGSASVSIEVQRISDAISVPIDAVDSEENVYVVNKQGILEKRLVKTGLYNDEQIEIVSGLEAGDVVALPGAQELSEGMKVRND